MIRDEFKWLPWMFVLIGLFWIVLSVVLIVIGG